MMCRQPRKRQEAQDGTLLANGDATGTQHAIHPNTAGACLANLVVVVVLDDDPARRTAALDDTPFETRTIFVETHAAGTDLNADLSMRR